MDHMGNGAHGAIVYRGYGVQGVYAMGLMGNGAHRVWGTWAIGAQGYGVQGVWAMGYRGMGPMGNGAQGVWVQGVWDTWAMGPMGDLLPKYQKDVKLSKRCQVVKKMSNVKKSNT